jgi:hypothetical protein
MRKRRTLLASVTFTFVFAVGLITTTFVARAEECLSKPNSPAPQGEHWYYRIDHANNRQCWRLGPEGVRVQKIVPQASEKRPAPEAAAQPAQPATKPATVQGHTTTGTAAAETAAESNDRTTGAPAPWPDASTSAVSPFLPLLPQTTPTARPQVANATDSAPTVEEPTSTKADETSEPASEHAEDPQPSVSESDPQPVPAQTTPQDGYTLDLLTLTLMLLAIAGPTVYVVGRLRERKARNLRESAMEYTFALDSPTLLTHPSLAPDFPIEKRHPSIPPTSPEQTERLAQALQQLADRLRTEQPPESNIEQIRPARRAMR